MKNPEQLETDQKCATLGERQATPRELAHAMVRSIFYTWRPFPSPGCAKQPTSDFEGYYSSVYLTGTNGGDNFGQSVALIHDLNKDGIFDLAVGAPNSAYKGLKDVCRAFCNVPFTQSIAGCCPWRGAHVCRPRPAVSKLSRSFDIDPPRLKHAGCQLLQFPESKACSFGFSASSNLQPACMTSLATFGGRWAWLSCSKLFALETGLGTNFWTRATSTFPQEIALVGPLRRFRT